MNLNYNPCKIKCSSSSVCTAITASAFQATVQYKLTLSYVSNNLIVKVVRVGTWGGMASNQLQKYILK